MNFFDISSVCIVWASNNPGKIGNDILRNLSEFKWKIYGVNPKWGSYKDIVFHQHISDLPKIPDIAVFCIPASFVATSLRECGEKWIKRAIVISAGFKEIGNLTGEEELKKIGKKYGIDLLWPNCLGYIDTSLWLNLSFGGKAIQRGNIAMISQSWAMAVAFTDWAYEYNVGFSKIISMGNKCDLSENDFLQELAHDKKTDVIALYLESIEDGKKFYEITKKLSKKKPIVIIKSGMSECGLQAAASHTWALAGCADVMKSVFSRAGLHYTNKLEEFFLWAQGFSMTKDIDIPEEMVVITNAGWPGVMTTDHMEFEWVPIAQFSVEEKKILMEWLPDAASVKNPIDIIGDATSIRYEQILKNIVSLGRNLAIHILLTPQTTTDVYTVAHKVHEFQLQHPSVVILCGFMGGHSLWDSRKYLEENKILSYNYPQKAVGVFERLIKQKKWSEKRPSTPHTHTPPTELKKIQHILKTEKSNGNYIVENTTVQDILRSYDISIPEEYNVTDIAEVENACTHLKFPVVAKVASSDIAHKTDIGGVILWIKDLESAKNAYKEITKNIQKAAPKSKIDGIVYTSQILDSHEVFVGLKRDVSFGDILIIGKWGIYVNIYNDSVTEVLPISKTGIEDMINRLTISPILKWARWKPAIRMTQLIDNITKLCQLFHDIPEIREIDINPIQCSAQWIYVIDTKLYI